MLIELALFLTLGFFLVIGTPIAIALGISSIVGIIAADLPPMYFTQQIFGSLTSFPLLAVPFFILAGAIMQNGSLVHRLLNVSRLLVGRFTGGLAHISVLTSLFFGALSGSSPATVAAIGGIMIPEMRRENYKAPFATAVCTAAGCLGVIIPPSVPLIIYGTTAGVSVGDLFIAGILPGIVIGITLMVVVYLIARRHGYGAQETVSEHPVNVSAILWQSLPALLVPVIILGGIYGGIMTPTEAGAVAVLYAFVIEVCVFRSITLLSLWNVFYDSMSITAAIFFVIATATLFGKVLLFYSIPEMLASGILHISTDKYIVLAIIILILLIAGMFMDALANILILTPLFLPVVNELGMDLVHFGIVMIIAISIGFLTPPVGVNLFVGSAIGRVSIERLSLAVLPFIAAILIALTVISVVPQISLVLL